MPTLAKQPTSWISSAPISFSVEQQVMASPTQVWAALTNYEGWTDWFPGLKACRPIDSAIDGVGSTRFVHLDAFKVTEEITEWEPERTWAMSVVEANLPVLSGMAERVIITPTHSGGSRIEWATGAAMTWWSAPLKSVLVGNTKKSITGGLASLDDYIAQLPTS